MTRQIQVSDRYLLWWHYLPYSCNASWYHLFKQKHFLLKCCVRTFIPVSYVCVCPPHPWESSELSASRSNLASIVNMLILISGSLFGWRVQWSRGINWLKNSPITGPINTQTKVQVCLFYILWERRWIITSNKRQWCDCVFNGYLHYCNMMNTVIEINVATQHHIEESIVRWLKLFLKLMFSLNNKC